MPRRSSPGGSSAVLPRAGHRLALAVTSWLCLLLGGVTPTLAHEAHDSHEGQEEAGMLAGLPEWFPLVLLLLGAGVLATTVLLQRRGEVEGLTADAGFTVGGLGVLVAVVLLLF